MNDDLKVRPWEPVTMPREVDLEKVTEAIKLLGLVPEQVQELHITPTSVEVTWRMFIIS